MIRSNVDQRRVRRERLVTRDHKLEKFVLDVAFPERRDSCMCGEPVCGADTGVECLRPVHRFLTGFQLGRNRVTRPSSTRPKTDSLQLILFSDMTTAQSIGGAIGDVRANIDIPSLNKYLTDSVKQVKAPVQVKQFKVITPG